MQKYQSFQEQLLQESPIVIGTLTAFLDFIIDDIENGKKINTEYYKTRLIDLQERFPDIYHYKRHKDLLELVNNH